MKRPAAVSVRSATRAVAVLLAVWGLTGCGDGSVRIVLGAGTTLVDSGVIDQVVAAYEEQHPGVTVSVVGEATGQLLALAENRAVDLTLTHAPRAEASFLAKGGVAAEAVVFTSRFAVVGPPDAAPELGGLTVPEAFAHIASRRFTFVSRADGSGTNETERAIWDSIGVDPTGAGWYLETGQGMGLTLQVASERRGFTLSELGTFLVAAPTLDLVDTSVAGPELENPYRLMVVAGVPEERQALDFFEWMRSKVGRAALVEAQREIFGPRLVYRPPD